MCLKAKVETTTYRRYKTRNRDEQESKEKQENGELRHLAPSADNGRDYERCKETRKVLECVENHS
jgi:hypothetical protein